MSLQEAKLFIARYVKGAFTPDEHGAFREWLGQASIDDLDDVAAEFEMLEADWAIPPVVVPAEEWMAKLEYKLDQMEPIIETPVREIGFGRVIKKKNLLVAASLFGLMVVGAVLYSHRINKEAEKNQLAALSSEFSTAKGQTKHFVLPDGSEVWLNASSSLRYPAVFQGKEREVELSGEAYFDIKANAAQPFKVKVRDYNVKVLGTHFDVMGYDDEPVSKTTLIEGAVKIIRGSEEEVLQPGQQAEMNYPPSNAGPSIKLIQGVDPELVIGWRRGMLEFNNDDLFTALRKISRHYDVNVRYEGDIPSTPSVKGGINMDESLENALKVLESPNISFKIENKTIIVRPRS